MELIGEGLTMIWQDQLLTKLFARFNMKIDYKKEYKVQLKQNLSEVIKNLDNKDFSIKIKNWAEKFEYSFDKIKEKIISDEIFRCVFVKDPAKQSLHQKLAAKYIKSLALVRDFKSLPSGGKNAIYLTNGKIFRGLDLKEKSKDTKSVDFIWKCGEKIFYACHKYTEISGGAQDNQYKDVQEFLKNTRDCNEKDIIFVAICDGEYYLGKDSSTGHVTKIERLERLTDGKTSFVTTINKLEEFLIQFNTK